MRRQAVPLRARRSGLYGIQRIDMVKDCLILAGAGVGGGSLVYANTLYEPLDAVLPRPVLGAHHGLEESELAPYYDQAKRMLGVVENAGPHAVRRGDEAGRRGDGRRPHVPPHARSASSSAAPARPGRGRCADPFFGGAGPARNACLNCGECMTGCRHNAKNTLVKNYLHLAEQAGAVVHPLTTVTARTPPRRGRLRGHGPLDQGQAVAPDGRQDVHRRPGRLLRRRARHPEAAAPAQGRGLPAPRSATGSGVLTRTNSEAILGATASDRRPIDYTRGRRDHLVASTPTRSPTSSRSATAGLQRDGADADGAGRRRARRVAGAHLAARAVGAARRPATSTTSALVASAP